MQVFLFPLKANRPGPGAEPDFASPVHYFPMLSGVVEFDVAGPVDFKPAEFM